MSLPKLYLETTIPSYLTARRSPLARIATDQQTTQDWWDFQRHEYDLFISEAVIEEISLVPKLQERARPACWRGRPAFANYPARRVRKACAITPHAAGSSFRRDAETSTRDASAPRKRSARRFHAMPGFR